MNDSEVSKTVKSDLAVNVGIDAPGGSSSLLAKHLSLSFTSLVGDWITTEVQSSIEGRPVNLVIGTLEVPVKHGMSGGIVPISNGVASGKELSLLAKVHSEVTEWLVASSAVRDGSTGNVLHQASSD